MQDLLLEFEPYKTKIPEFVIKIYHILEQKQFNDIICWVNDNTEILIKSSKKLQEKVLPRFFRHKHLTSFIRQLNMYGFSKAIKLTKQKNHTYFRNQFFKRGQIAQLTKIKRKNTKKRIQDKRQLSVDLQNYNEGQLSVSSEEQSFISIPYPKQVLNSVYNIQSQVERVINLMNAKQNQRKKGLRKNKYNNQLEDKNLYYFNKEQIDQQTLQKLQRVINICKQIKQFTFEWKDKINNNLQFKEQENQQSENSLMLEGKIKAEQSSVVINNKEDEEKDQHKNMTMFKSIKQMLPKFDSIPYFASQCSLQKQNQQNFREND